MNVNFDFNIKNKRRFFIFLGIVLLILAAVAYYVFLPAFNIGSLEMWIFIIFISLLVGMIQFLLGFKERKVKLGTFFIGLGLVLAAIIMVGSFINSPLFRAKDYATLITVEEKDFATDFAGNDTSGIPLMDRDTATRLGDRQLGGVAELVSQFVPADDYIQINIDNVPYRVSPLQYASFFRWVNNRENGVPGYIRVNMVTGNA